MMGFFKLGVHTLKTAAKTSVEDTFRVTSILALLWSASQIKNEITRVFNRHSFFQTLPDGLNTKTDLNKNNLLQSVEASIDTKTNNFHPD